MDFSMKTIAKFLPHLRANDRNFFSDRVNGVVRARLRWCVRAHLIIWSALGSAALAVFGVTDEI